MDRHFKANPRTPEGGNDQARHRIRGGRTFIRSGRSVFSSRVWGEIAASLRLSNRESQIVQCIFDSEQELGIAARLGISHYTVHTHMERLYRKLHVRSRSELAVRVIAQYLHLSSSEPVWSENRIDY